MIKDPARLAWAMLITAFVIFCVVTAAALLGIRWFLFDSTVPLQVYLSVGRGTVGVTVGDNVEQTERTGRVLIRGVRLTNDNSSQGYITFTDSYSQQIVATLTLHRDSTMVLGDTTRPRFDFGNGAFIINVLSLEGDADVDIIPGLGWRIRFNVFDANRNQIRITQAGRYLLTGQSESLYVLNRAGEAVLFNNTGQARSAPTGMEGHIGPDGTFTVETTLVDILPDGSFETVNAANPNLLTNWGCYDEPDPPGNPEDPPPINGEYRRENLLGRSVVHISRSNGASSHGETGCQQFLYRSSEGLNVETFNYLELRANLFIRYQSLSTCGQEGSECPMMLVMRYVDVLGRELNWIHGFYADHNPSLGFPLRCASCSIDHERINANTWYTFSSGNLFQLLPEDQRPREIIYVQFYASGHQYDVLMNEVALMAGHIQQPIQEAVN